MNPWLNHELVNDLLKLSKGMVFVGAHAGKLLCQQVTPNCGTGVHLAILENTRNVQVAWNQTLEICIYIYIFSLKVREGFIKTCLFISSSYLASSQMHPPTIFSPAQNDHGSVFMYFHAGQQEIVRQPLVWLWFKMWAHLFWTHHLCITCRIWNFQLQSRPPWYPYPTTSTQVATCGKTSLLPRAGHLSEVRAF